MTRDVGDWSETYTGRQYWTCDPDPEDVDLEDIAHSLSRQCRFAGHVENHYSVAQHCVLVAHHCIQSPREGLMHDATEAYLVDIPRPYKRALRDYKFYEDLNARAIGRRFDLDLVTLPREVHEQDARALATEKRDLRRPTKWVWNIKASPWPARINPWSAEYAKGAFLSLARELGIG
jgi:uncharacterized protein